jgi:hypothetical protein
MTNRKRALISLLAERSEEVSKLRSRIILLEIVIDELKDPGNGCFSTDNSWAMKQIAEVKATHPREVKVGGN